MKKTFSKKCLKFTAILFLISVLFILNFIPVFATERKLIPIGQTTGIILHSDGVVVIGFSDEYGKSPAETSGIQRGDIIIAVNGNPITDKKTLSYALSNCSNANIKLTVLRNYKKQDFTVSAIYDPKTDIYIIGIKAKDTIAGIGTITYIDPITGEYGALGHGIADPETSTLNLFDEGKLVPSTVVSVERGKKGDPGELVGSFDMNNSQGSVTLNKNCGIFGRIEDPKGLCRQNAIEVGDEEDVVKGKAQILSNVSSNTVKQYDIEIISISKESNDNREMMIKVVDKELLSSTGGIVQGMSGSPIIQNGKIIGAVTHVLINDPTRGYGIFIDTMLKKAG